jgi:hypothetical protein
MVAMPLWDLQAWAHEAAAVHSPILLFTSAEAGSGKTTGVELNKFLVPRGLSTVGISEAALFRAIEMYEPTIAVDEADTILVENEALRAVINSGWTRGSGVLRCVGESNTPHLFPTFSPKILGSKGLKFPDTVLSRSIIIEMKRRKASEKVEHFDARDDEGLAGLRRQALRWTIDNAEALRTARPEMPAGFENRLGDNWRLMFAIADLAGGEWPERAREAAVVLSKRESASLGVQLLADIRDFFQGRADLLTEADRVWSANLVEVLIALDERPWADFKRGKGLTQAQLARLLRPSGVVSGSVRIGVTTHKGYYLHQFQDAFERYLADGT